MGAVSAALTAAITDALDGHHFATAPITADMIINHLAGTEENAALLLRTTSEVDMVATSHDVMLDIELYQPTDEANALALANTLGSDGWLLAGARIPSAG